MKQKLNDLVLLVKHDKKWQILTVALVFLIIWSFVTDTSTTRRGKKRKPTTISTGISATDENIKETIDTFVKNTDKIQKKISENSDAIQTIVQGQEKNEDQITKILAGIIERVKSVEDGSTALASQKGSISPANIPQDTLTTFGDVDEAATVAPPKRPSAGKEAFIGAGDSVRIKLIAGVNAPTDGTPYPVVFKLEGDVTGPDGSALPLGEARIIAAANGSLADHRVLYRLNKMNIRHPDGSRQVVDIDGWVVGEDGIRGMEGLLIDPLGRILASAAAAGGIQGALQNGNSQQNINGEVVSIDNLGQGAANEVGAEISGYIKERSDLLVPHVKVLSGRSATAVFSQNVTITGLYDKLDEPDSVFVSLD